MEVNRDLKKTENDSGEDEDWNSHRGESGY